MRLSCGSQQTWLVAPRNAERSPSGSADKAPRKVEAPEHSRDGSPEHHGQHEELVRGVHVLQEGRWPFGADVANWVGFTIGARFYGELRALPQRLRPNIFVERSNTSFHVGRRVDARPVGDHSRTARPHCHAGTRSSSVV